MRVCRKAQAGRAGRRAGGDKPRSGIAVLSARPVVSAFGPSSVMGDCSGRSPVRPLPEGKGTMQQLLGQDGRYRPMRRIDAGGMGEIWEADDTLLGRRVAIKVLAEELAGDPVALRRFRREARATAKLDHPNVIRVFDFVDGEIPFLVLELLEGQTLADRLGRDGALSPAEAARIAAAVADGLDMAHRAGILHRDIKPSNIMLTARGGGEGGGFGDAGGRAGPP